MILWYIPDGAKTVSYMHSGMQNVHRRGKSQGHLFRSHGNSPSARHLTHTLLLCRSFVLKFHPLG